MNELADYVVNEKPVSSWEADGAITAHAVVVSDAKGKVKLGAAENDANVQGVAPRAAADGKAVDVVGIGAIAWVVAAAAITYGARLIVANNEGDVKDCPETAATTYNICGHARGSCSNASELVPMLVTIYTHTVET